MGFFPFSGSFLAQGFKQTLFAMCSIFYSVKKVEQIQYLASIKHLLSN